jgi:hypothetical protein
MIYGRPYKGFQKNPPYTSSNYSSLEYFGRGGGFNFVSSQSGDVPQEDFVSFGYKLNMKVIFLKT